MPPDSAQIASARLCGTQGDFHLFNQSGNLCRFRWKQLRKKIWNCWGGSTCRHGMNGSQMRKMLTLLISQEWWTRFLHFKYFRLLQVSRKRQPEGPGNQEEGLTPRGHFYELWFTLTPYMAWRYYTWTKLGKYKKIQSVSFPAKIIIFFIIMQYMTRAILTLMDPHL